MKPRQLQITIAWMVIATLLIGAALWQAQMAAARDLADRHKAPAPPARTRHAVRIPAKTASGDAVEIYIARCRKGMTRQEIAWILEDYQIAGLDFDTSATDLTAPPRFALRSRQQRWYRNLLVEALQLDPAQKALITSRLAALLHQAMERYQEQAGLWQSGEAVFPPVPPSTTWWNQDGDPFGELDPAILPENLCELTASQKSVLTRADDRFNPTGNLVEILPLFPQAGELHHGNSLLQQALTMHPAQLKLRLLVAGIAGELQRLLAETSDR